ncbi:MAG: hypothetical protein CVV33_08520, partial [Methanomicrobiales archaeon HGW-Methanomicrobiales-4]
IILVTADGTGVGATKVSSQYEVELNSTDKSSLYQIDHTPSTLTIPGGNSSIQIQIYRKYVSGTRVLVLQTTV